MKRDLIPFLARERSSVARYASAVLAACVTLLINWVVHEATDRVHFFLSTAATAIVSLIFGFGPGMLTALLATAGILILTPSKLTFAEEVLRTGLSLITAIMLATLSGLVRSALISEANARREAEDAIRSRDEFISMVTHELKNPLSALKLQAQLAARRRKNDESVSKTKIDHFVRTADQTLNRALRIIDDLLDISRVSHGKLSLVLEPVEASKLVCAVVERFSLEMKAKGCSIQCQTESGVFGTWDSARIEQVLTNLLTNACKYGGDSPIEVDVRDHGDTAVFSVKDYGPGISPEDQQKIFGKFERLPSHSKITGLGLGLYITQRIIELHGGRIWLESQLGKGSTFLFELPKTPVQSLHPAA